MGPRRHLWDVHPGRPRRRRVRPRKGGRRLREDGDGWHQRHAPLHRPAAVAARCRRASRPLGRGRHPLGGAHHVPRPARPSRLDPRSGPRGRAALRRSSGGPRVQHRQRDPVADRPVAWHAAHRRIPGASDGHGPRRGPGRPRDVRELPDDRVPARARARLRVVERLPRGSTPPTNAMSRVSRTSPTTGRSSSPSSERTAVARGPTSRPS